MNRLRRVGFVIALCIVQLIVFPQTDSTTEIYAAGRPRDFMSSSGKIYVVMAVVVVIVLGIFIYLMNLDRKIKKLERK